MPWQTLKQPSGAFSEYDLGDRAVLYKTLRIGTTRPFPQDRLEESWPHQSFALTDYPESPLRSDLVLWSSRGLEWRHQVDALGRSTLVRTPVHPSLVQIPATMVEDASKASYDVVTIIEVKGQPISPGYSPLGQLDRWKHALSQSLATSAVEGTGNLASGSIRLASLPLPRLVPKQQSRFLTPADFGSEEVVLEEGAAPLRSVAGRRRETLPGVVPRIPVNDILELRMARLRLARLEEIIGGLRLVLRTLPAATVVQASDHAVAEWIVGAKRIGLVVEATASGGTRVGWFANETPVRGQPPTVLMQKSAAGQADLLPLAHWLMGAGAIPA